MPRKSIGNGLNPMLTEKYLNSVYGCNFPILLVSVGSIRLLRDIGFDMFDDIVDHGYDLAPNDCRVEMALESNRPVISSHYDTSRLLPRLRANKELALVTLPDWYQTNFKIRARAIAEL
jgi:hypothetical protein